MPWPLSQDYNEAIQSPSQCFADPELRQGEAVTNELGLPAPRSGNFADVYALVTGQRKWAVKCFTRQIPGLQERYQQISLHLEEVKLPFMVDFTFLDRGIKVRGHWYPILKMQWVEGLTLNQFVKSNLDKPQLLDVLCQLWVKLATRLREANIAHCDLQHGNVLLVAGERAGKLSVKLVDYDGMCVPSLTLLKSIEVGHPAYQHPQRQREGIYSLEVDRFSHLVIYTALRALMTGGKPLWEKHDDGDNLLFKPADYAAPTKSRLFYEMLKSPIGEVSKLVHVMMEASAGPLEQTPLLDQVAASVPRASALPIAATMRGNDHPRLGILADMPNGNGRDVVAPGAVNADTMGEFGGLNVHVKRKANLKHTPSPEGKPTKWPIAIGLGVFGLLLAVLGTLWAGGVFRVQTKDGVLVVQVSEPNADVFMAGEKVTVTWGAGGKTAEIHVKPGTYQVSVKKDGFTAKGQTVTLEEGGRHVITVRLERNPPPPPPPPPNTLEGEELNVLGKSGNFPVGPQDMSPFTEGKWSGDSQLWCQPPRQGAWVDLELPVAADGKYHVVVYMTKARDYGIVQFSLNGKPLGRPIDGFNFPEVVSTGAIDLGTVELKKGRSTLRAEVVDTNEKSVGLRYMWGLDCVELKFAPESSSRPARVP